MKSFLLLFIFSFSFLVFINAQDENHQLKISFASKEKSRVAVNALYTYKFEAHDSNQNNLSYSVKKLPAWLHYNAAKNSISGIAKKVGQFPIHIMATNGKDTISQQFMLTVFDKQTTNILCLGNSITNGTSTFNSYRRDLWQMLHKGNYNFDFIGSWSKHHMGGEMPNADFDLDHEGHSGWTAADIFHAPNWDSTRGNINLWLEEYTLDIVLVELGTNDVFQCRKIPDVLKNFSDLIQLLRKKNKKVKIFFAQIPPLGSQWAEKKLCGNDSAYDQSIRNLNKAIAIFVKNNSTISSPLFVVDQYSGITAANQYDDIHPNLSGEKIMAQ
ncbi:MAG TPA: GDSL-type esterase/lipase family protein, partial [Puia sp.]|nr:GDSL-type esterase/lipase family protein [Puia sp.]